MVHMFRHHKKYHNNKMEFEPSNPVIYEAAFDKKNWESSKFGHLEVKEEIRANITKTSGVGFVI